MSFEDLDTRWQCVDCASCECVQASSPIWNSDSSGDFKQKLQNTQDHLAPQFWWNQVVEPYSARELTLDADKLVAISALAFEFQNRFDYTYLAGLWMETILNDMAWHTYEGAQGRRTKQNKLPSWSWASVSGQVFNFSRPGGESTALVDFVEAYTRPSTMDRFGQVSEGRLKVRGAIAMAKGWINHWSGSKAIWSYGIDCYKGFISLDTPVTPVKVRQEDGLVITTVRRSSRGRQPKKNGAKFNDFIFWLLPLFFDRDSDPFKVRVLILVPSHEKKNRGCYERIGIDTLTFGSPYINRQSEGLMKLGLTGFFNNNFQEREIIII